MLAIKIEMVDKKPLKRTEPKTAAPIVIKKTIMSPREADSVMMFAPIVPPRTVSPVSSKPIRETTAPMAAGGRMTFIQEVPNL